MDNQENDAPKTVSEPSVIIKPKAPKARKVYKKHYVGEIEIYDHMFKCPSCQQRIIQGDKYCSSCGVRLIWSAETDSI